MLLVELFQQPRVSFSGTSFIPLSRIASSSPQHRDGRLLRAGVRYLGAARPLWSCPHQGRDGAEQELGVSHGEADAATVHV